MRQLLDTLALQEPLTPTQTEYVCFAPDCTATVWQVTSGHYRELWHLSDETGSSYQVAATRPICPRCGDTLLPVGTQEN